MPSAEIVLYVTITLIAEAGTGAVNYCSARMCGHMDTHTFCQYPPGPSPRCVGYINAELTMEEKSRVIARLNRRRNEAAEGRLRGLPSAGNMLKLRWVEELARAAQLWADQCRPPTTTEEHDECRDLYSVSVGQCVASVVGEAPGLRVESMVDIWYMQNMHYKGNATIYIPPNQNSAYYGDFGQMLWAQSYMVGCGRSKFMNMWNGRLRSVERLICNFAPRGPATFRPLWSPSAPATLCPPRTKRDQFLPALCDIQKYSSEIVEVDASMSLEEHLLLNTVLDIEGNHSLTYPGSLDEIYLTRLTIANMDNVITTQTFYNSMQRRDVIESIESADEKFVNISSTQDLVTSQTVHSESNSISASLPATKINAKHAPLIGRPKPYNMEELTDSEAESESNSENYSPSEGFNKRNAEFYPEYEFAETEPNVIESLDNKGNTSLSENDNITSVDEKTELTTNAVGVTTAREYQLRILHEGSTSLSSSKNAADKLIYNTIVDNNNTQTDSVQNISQEIKDVEEYLSDPETVRQLQIVLDNMEHEASLEATSERQRKVRRELREFTETTTQQKSDEISKEELERNRTRSEKGATWLLKKVFGSLPYLKEYEGSSLSKASCSHRASLYNVLVLCFCFNF